MVKALQKFPAWLRSRLGLNVLRGDDFTPDAAKRYRRAQITEALAQTKPLMLGNTLFAPMMALQVAGAAPTVGLVAWTLLMILGSWGLLLWTEPLRKCKGDVTDLRRLEYRALIDGALWGIGFACIYPFAEGDAKVIVAIIVTGAVSLGTFGYSRAAGSGLLYLISTTFSVGLGGFTFGVMHGSVSDILIPLLCGFAFVTLAKSLLDRARADLEAHRNLEKLAEKTEVVELLVKDYEAQATEWMWQTDCQGRLLVAPDLIMELLSGGRPLEHNEDVLHQVDRVISPECYEAYERMASAVRQRKEFHDIILAFNDHKNDDLRWIAVKGRPQFDAGLFQGYRGIIADTTKAVVAERQVQYLAAFDSLTGLYNRNSIQKKLGQLDPKTDRVTPIMIDLDGFKQINDTYGHETGDALLCAVADRLRMFEGEGAWTARLAGDEFFMLLTDHDDISPETNLAFGKDICDRLSEPFHIKEFELQISASVGLARFPNDTDVGADLLSYCDLALYEAKNNGRNQPRTFGHEMLEELNWRVALIERLKQSVQDGRVELHYQTQHCLSDGRLIGLEALARWNDDELGFVGPDIFIPIAEQTGLILDLGEQLLRKACQDAKHWSDQLGGAAPVVSVNISPVQFARIDVAEMIAKTLADTGLPPALIEIEVTEGVLISDKSRVAATLQELSAMGVSIALDDFGTGYSSLSYLKELPLNRLKIDRSFINDLDDDPESPIVETVIQLGQNLGLNVIAEGVETQMQIDLLAAMGCDEGQGYHYSRPVPKSDLDAYITSLISDQSKKAG
jgi:diguanylate cyclase (GGDEF)-like protein